MMGKSHSSRAQARNDLASFFEMLPYCVWISTAALDSREIQAAYQWRNVA